MWNDGRVAERIAYWCEKRRRTSVWGSSNGRTSFRCRRNDVWPFAKSGEFPRWNKTVKSSATVTSICLQLDFLYNFTFLHFNFKLIRQSTRNRLKMIVEIINIILRSGLSFVKRKMENKNKSSIKSNKPNPVDHFSISRQ